MTIHPEHPFLPPESDRDPLRRFRGRMASPVSVWTSGSGRQRAGWTISSFMVADGDPAELIGLLDADSDLWDRMQLTGTVAVSLLSWPHRQLSEVFAGQAPAPGGPFTVGAWADTEWGPVLTDSPAWLGARLEPQPDERAGWAVLVRARIEHAEIAAEGATDALIHWRGRYRELPGR